jgi:hypothetical protein
MLKRNCACPGFEPGRVFTIEPYEVVLCDACGRAVSQHVGGVACGEVVEPPSDPREELAWRADQLDLEAHRLEEDATAMRAAADALREAARILARHSS